MDGSKLAITVPAQDAAALREVADALRLPIRTAARVVLSAGLSAIRRDPSNLMPTGATARAVEL
jgi:hypothetical protein